MPQESAAQQLNEGDAVIFIVDVTDEMLTDREDDTVSIIKGQTGLVMPTPIPLFEPHDWVCVMLDYDNRIYMVRQSWVKEVEL